MSRGTAKIVTNEGSGLYTITQVFFNVATGTYGTGTVGLVKADASDVALFAGYSVDDVVKFEIQETYDGLSRAVIWGSGGTVVGDEVWIHAVTAGDTTTISHIGPDDSAHLGTSFTMNIDVDATGHVREWKNCAGGQCGPCA